MLDRIFKSALINVLSTPGYEPPDTIGPILPKGFNRFLSGYNIDVIIEFVVSELELALVAFELEHPSEVKQRLTFQSIKKAVHTAKREDLKDARAEIKEFLDYNLPEDTAYHISAALAATINLISLARSDLSNSRPSYAQVYWVVSSNNSINNACSKITPEDQIRRFFAIYNKNKAHRPARL